MSELKPCPFRVHGERTASLTVAGEYYYNETFMPCMGSGCACFNNNCDDPYCDRNGSYMRLAQKGRKGERVECLEKPPAKEKLPDLETYFERMEDDQK